MIELKLIAAMISGVVIGIAIHKLHKYINDNI